jgi:hypothetical protein
MTIDNLRRADGDSLGGEASALSAGKSIFLDTLPKDECDHFGSNSSQLL